MLSLNSLRKRCCKSVIEPNRTIDQLLMRLIGYIISIYARVCGQFPISHLKEMYRHAEVLNLDNLQIIMEIGDPGIL